MVPYKKEALLRIQSDNNDREIFHRLAIVLLAAGIDIEEAENASVNTSGFTFVVLSDDDDRLNTCLLALEELINRKSKDTKTVENIIQEFRKNEAEISLGERVISFPPIQAKELSVPKEIEGKLVEGCVEFIDFEKNAVKINGCNRPIVFPTGFALILSMYLSQIHIVLEVIVAANWKNGGVECTEKSAIKLLKTIADGLIRSIRELEEPQGFPDGERLNPN